MSGNRSANWNMEHLALPTTKVTEVEQPNLSDNAVAESEQWHAFDGSVRPDSIARIYLETFLCDDIFTVRLTRSPMVDDPAATSSQHNYRPNMANVQKYPLFGIPNAVTVDTTPIPLDDATRELYKRAVADPSSITDAEMRTITLRPPLEQEDELCREKCGMLFEQVVQKALRREQLNYDEALASIDKKRPFLWLWEPQDTKYGPLRVEFNAIMPLLMARLTQRDLEGDARIKPFRHGPELGALHKAASYSRSDDMIPVWPPDPRAT